MILASDLAGCLDVSFQATFRTSLPTLRLWDALGVGVCLSLWERTEKGPLAGEAAISFSCLTRPGDLPQIYWQLLTENLA